jgi:hypothetical protein
MAARAPDSMDGEAMKIEFLIPYLMGLISGICGVYMGFYLSKKWKRFRLIRRLERMEDTIKAGIAMSQKEIDKRCKPKSP